MVATRETIDRATLLHLVEAGAIRGADVIGQAGGWGVVIKYGMTERALAARRGAVRIFARFETLVSYLKAIGIAEYKVNAANFNPLSGKVLRARPDAAERMKAAHEAAAYDQWFRAKVQKSLDGLKDGTNPVIPDEKWQAKRADKLRARKALA
jgi:hypothetical protein